jgi:hypothetical protein
MATVSPRDRGAHRHKPNRLTSSSRSITALPVSTVLMKLIGVASRCARDRSSLAGDTLPAAEVIVNPNQPACGFPSKNLAGVGVMFYTLACTARRAAPARADSTVPVINPGLIILLDLVALGTVADVVQARQRITVFWSSQGLSKRIR